MGWRNLPTSISAAINMAAKNGQVTVTVQWLEQLGTENEEAEVEIHVLFFCFSLINVHFELFTRVWSVSIDY
jgi:hypothetical protein